MSVAWRPPQVVHRPRRPLRRALVLAFAVAWLATGGTGTYLYAQRYWLYRGQDKLILPDINKLFAYGAPASIPPLNQMWDAWRTITQAADLWLDTLTTEKLLDGFTIDADGTPLKITFGSMLRRTTYHYWYHTGENMAIRQMLGQTGLPDFVGNIDGEAPYIPE